MANLIEAWQVNLAQVIVKFEPSVKTSSITNNRLALFTNSATPVLISDDPFETIDLAEDYNSISKILTLTWKEDILEPETSYKLRFSGFRYTNNALIEDDWIAFETEESVEPDPGDIPVVPDAPVIVDYTIIDDPVVVSEATVDEDDDEATFKLVSSDPINNDAFLPEDYNNGVLILKFNASPDPSFLTEEYFVAQQKEIKRTPSRWETVDVEIEAHSTKPWVYVKFPSNDATPVYEEADKVYFEKNHKYRVKISGEVGY